MKVMFSMQLYYYCRSFVAMIIVSEWSSTSITMNTVSTQINSWLNHFLGKKGLKMHLKRPQNGKIGKQFFSHCSKVGDDAHLSSLPP